MPGIGWALQVMWLTLAQLLADEIFLEAIALLEWALGERLNDGLAILGKLCTCVD